MCASPTGNCGCRRAGKPDIVGRALPQARYFSGNYCAVEAYYTLAIVAVRQGYYATIHNYLETELRYMDAGERGSKAPTLGHQGTPGYQ
jgi:hypothetical protein